MRAGAQAPVERVSCRCGASAKASSKSSLTRPCRSSCTDQVSAPAEAAPAAEAAPEADPLPTLADMVLEGEVQVDQAVFDKLIADGKSERMARSKAKAAWVKGEKQKMLDALLAERGLDGDAAGDVDSSEGES